MNQKKINLQGILKRIEKARIESGRRDEIKLVAISKKFSAHDIKDFYQLGIKDFGENYVQEWVAKKDYLPSDIVWHFVGKLQSNKTKFVAENADWVQSIDRFKIIKRVNEQRPEEKSAINVCIEVNISREKQKNGVYPEYLEDLVADVLSLSKIRLRGLMCIPEADNLAKLSEEMQEMQELFLKLKKIPDIDTLSMGMSADLELAIKYGSTMVRVGTALFGRRT